jgi:glutamate-1-semialdehyde 2,1-aminomutase
MVIGGKDMPFSLEKSVAAFAEAKLYLPGGVNSPVRSFRGVGGTPPFIAKASGSRVFDIDGNEYIDYVGSWGPMILGHAHPRVTEALKQALELGTSYGAPTLLETQLAKLVQQAFPSMEIMRMVNSGTEATMSALRLARAFTNRTCIVKFDGCYHGHHDSLLVKAGSGATTLGVPDSPGVPCAIAQTTLTLPFNDIQAMEELFGRRGEDIAAVIIEPVPGNMGLILPKEGYLQKVRELTKKYGILLIFDEVMSGFRVAFGGAQELFGIVPDITCLGKVIGGGLPVGAYGGKKEIMEYMAPAGPVYQAGTLSGNPLAMTAGIATLTIIKENLSFYKDMEDKTAFLGEAFGKLAAQAGLPVQTHKMGSMFGMFFAEKPVIDYESAKEADQPRFRAWFHAMLEKGVYMAPSQFEAAFMSSAHSGADLQKTVEAAEKAFAVAATVKK